MTLHKAVASQINEILSLYKAVVAGVAKTPMNLGWNTKRKEMKKMINKVKKSDFKSIFILKAT